MTAASIAGLRRLTCALIHDVRGAWMMEFALIMPLFLGSSLAALEYSNLVLSRQKMERVSATSADLFARNTVPPNERQVNDIFMSVNQIGKPFDIKKNGRVIVTGVIGTMDPDTKQIENKIIWQRCYGDLTSKASAIGVQWTGSNDYADGTSVTLPGNVKLGIAQMAVVSETFYTYQPLISKTALPAIKANEILRERSLFRVRGAPFTSITPVTGLTPKTC